MRPIYREMFGFIRAALHYEAPVLLSTELPDWLNLLQESKRHLLTAVVYAGIEKSAVKLDGDAAEQWRTEKDKVLYQAVLMEKERECVFELLNHNQVPYLPLKGYWIRDLYPKSWMRQMVDTDLLIDSDKRSVVRDLMLEKGYTTKRYGAGHHDVYLKKPMCCFEMHSDLFDASETPKFYSFFKSVDVNFSFSPDFFYLYFIAHLYHHYQQSGIGLRTLLDCYLYLSKRGEQINRSVLLQNLKELDLIDFEEQVRCLAFKLFGCDEIPLTAEDELFLEEFCVSGATGTLDLAVKRNMQRLKRNGKFSKWAYIKSRIFLPIEWFEDHLPFYAKHRWLIPAYYVFRLFRVIFIRGKRLRVELEMLKKESK